MIRSAFLAALLPLPALAEATWVTWDSPASGYIGSNPHVRDHFLYEDQDGLLLPAIWEATNAGPQALAGCAFDLDPATGGSRRGAAACPVELVVDVLDDGGQMVVIVKRLMALGQPGQEASFE